MIVTVVKIILLILSFLLGSFLRQLTSESSAPCSALFASNLLRGPVPINSIVKIAKEPAIAESDPVKCEKIPFASCPELPSPVLTTHMYHISNTVPEDLFGDIHHPSTPAKVSLLLTNDSQPPSFKKYMDSCQEIFLTRTGSRASQPNKCVAVVKVPPTIKNPRHLSYRIGETAKTINQYQKDFPRDKAFTEEEELLPELVKHLPELKAEFLSLMGEPYDEHGNRKTVVVMVANEGVIDLVLNFICSCEAINFDISKIIVFLGDVKYKALIENAGAKAMYSESLGSLPAQAAQSYLDHTFGRM